MLTRAQAIDDKLIALRRKSYALGKMHARAHDAHIDENALPNINSSEI